MYKNLGTEGQYEYLYSHHHDVSVSHMYSQAFVNIYVACAPANGGRSTHDGSIIRYDVQGDNSHEGMIDLPLRDADASDAITATWVHAMLVAGKYFAYDTVNIPAELRVRFIFWCILTCYMTL